MLHSTTRRAVVVGLVALSLPAGLTTANAAGYTTLARWEMNEPVGATVMENSSSTELDGVIGSGLSTGFIAGDVTAYRWLYVPPEEAPAKPERLVQVDDDDLNFGTRDFAISFRYRTTRPFGNIMQKGQAKTVGGQVKFQLPKGNVTCMVRGAAGQRAVRSLGSYRDGQWHTVRCERTAAGITMTVTDAAGVVVETKTLNGPTGNFANRFPFTIGGKLECDQVTVTCDYFTGEIDWVKIEVGT